MICETGEGWSMHAGDCIDGLSTLDDDSVDVTITDPPYEAQAHTLQRRAKRTGVCVTESLPFAAITEPVRTAVACEIERITRRWVLVFCQVEASQQWAQSLQLAGMDYVRTMVWIKPDAMPQYTGDRPGMGYESIVVAHRPGRKRWNGGGRTGVFECNKNGVGIKTAPHPTTKPLALMRELVELFTDPDELVCDPFAGSGSTGVACRMLKRRFIGWEISPEYFEIACRRLSGDEAKPNAAQGSLFA